MPLNAAMQNKAKRINERSSADGAILDVVGAGAKDLLASLRLQGYPGEDLRRIERTFDIVSRLHDGQVRPDGSPYVTHPLLVAKVLVKKFGIVEPAAVVSALLHDAPEDQAKRINALFGGVESSDKYLAIKLLSEQVLADPDAVRRHLTLLTNPDFWQMTWVLRKGSDPEDPLCHEAQRLFQLAEKLLVAKEHVVKPLSELNERECQYRLYLGHWCEIVAADRITLAIKVADFFTNGIHRHLLIRDIERGEHTNEAKIRLNNFAQRMKDKYGPVVQLLSGKLEESLRTQTPLINEKADRLVRLKLMFVAPFYGQ